MNSLLGIIALYFAGEYLTILLHLPFPGSITGFLLALLLLVLAPSIAPKLEVGSEILLRLLPLFLVPVAISIFFLFIEAETNFSYFAGVVLIALFFGIAMTGLTMKYLFRLFADEDKKSLK